MIKFPIALTSRFLKEKLSLTTLALGRKSYSSINKSAPKIETTKEDLSKMSLKSVGFFLATGSLLLGYFYYTKRDLDLAKENSNKASETFGKPKVGGNFSLVRDDGLPVTNLDFRGKYMLIYFGYTFCPDVCPEELEKMAIVFDSLEAKKLESKLVPIFVSCDPKRDSIDSIKSYLLDFHPKFVGLTGTHSQILKMAKLYRLYFSAPPRALDDDETDYLVDHSIFFYLMGPQGEFISHFGRNMTASEIVEEIERSMSKDKEDMGQLLR